MGTLASEVANAPNTQDRTTSTSLPTQANGTSRSETQAPSLSLAPTASPPSTPPMPMEPQESGTTPTTPSSDGLVALPLPSMLVLRAVSGSRSLEESQVTTRSLTTASCPRTTTTTQSSMTAQKTSSEQLRSFGFSVESQSWLMIFLRRQRKLAPRCFQATTRTKSLTPLDRETLAHTTRSQSE